MAFPTSNPAYKLVGRGRVEAAALDSAYASLGFRYLGDCEDFRYGISVEKLEDIPMDQPTNVPDLSVLIGGGCILKCTLKEFSPQNLALFSRGTKSALAQSSGGPVTDDTNWVGEDTLSASNVGCVFEHSKRNWSSGETVKAGSTSLVEGTDYEWDPIGGRLYIYPGCTATGALKISGSYLADTSAHIEGVMNTGFHAVKFIGNPVNGPKWEYTFYKVLLYGEGDAGLLSKERGSFSLTGDCNTITVGGLPSFYKAIERSA